MDETGLPQHQQDEESDGPSLSRDARALKQTRSRLRTVEFRLAAILNSAGQGVSLFDRHHRLVYCNQAFLDIYRLPPALGRRGTSFRAILEGRVKANTHVGDDPDDYIESRIESVREERVKGNIRHLNSGQVVSMTHHPMADGGWVSTHKDVTETVNMQTELTRLAYHDPLTGLPNRAMFYRKLGAALRELPLIGTFSVLCLDLDGFKPVNDLLGHAAGDMLLRSFADRLQAVAGKESCAARMGGDEFAVLLRGATREDAEHLARRIVEVTSKPFDLDGRQALISVGVGMAVAPMDGGNADVLMHRADLALYSAKRQSRGGVQGYEAGVVEDEREQERELRQALEDGAFELHFQPIIDLRAGSLSGFEALLRWRHPQRGLVLPGTFIPLAERCGLIHPLGEWVLRRTIEEAATWPADLRVAVNVSPVQLQHDGLPAFLVNTLATAGLAPHRLEIEVTETALRGDLDANKDLLLTLHRLGVRVALDDFGSGHATLGQLLELPLDRIKLDGRFVQSLDQGRSAAIILSAMANMGHELQVATTAKGIETAEQLKHVHTVGFDEAQGRLMSPPLTAAQVHHLLGSRQPHGGRDTQDRRAAG